MSGTANPGWSKAKYAARGVHLDQDTAGRLLESMGDHVRREMIVRTTHVIRQNTAYRPIANNVTTSGRYPRRLSVFTDYLGKTVNSRRIRTSWILLVYFA